MVTTMMMYAGLPAIRILFCFCFGWWTEMVLMGKGADKLPWWLDPFFPVTDVMDSANDIQILNFAGPCASTRDTPPNGGQPHAHHHATI